MQIPAAGHSDGHIVVVRRKTAEAFYDRAIIGYIVRVGKHPVRLLLP